MRKHFVRALAIAALTIGALMAPATASAAAPPNDDFASATVIDPSSLPFNDSIVIDDATLEGSEPSGCYVAGKSAWYSITPTADGVVRADIGGSSFVDRILYVYRQDGSGFGGLSTIGCASPYYNGQSAVTFDVEAGKTYYIQAGGFYAFTTGTLNLSVQAVPPPQNDDFANATVIGSLPFSDSIDTSAATIEPSEPTPSCGYGQPAGSAWYAFTPSSSASYTLGIPFSLFSTEVAAYTGSGLGSLSELKCWAFASAMTFHAQAGQTYYFQVGGVFGGRGTLGINLDVAANPVAAFFYSPNDPSTLETVQFFDQSSDPAGGGISSEVWQFGDGATASNPGCCPAHKYAKDGDYTVQLDVTTTDGRTASTQQVVHVRTHDVSIAKVTVPQTARVGQSKAISVGLTNGRYPENVQVELFKSVAGGTWQQVGVLTQDVPVRNGNRTTDFSFSYTFAPEDAVFGKVSFQAVATIQGARDAYLSDNNFISLPTKVDK
jgi:PKD domain